MELKVPNVYGLLIRSNLLPREESKAMYERWLAEAGEKAQSVEFFTKWMVANKYVTEFQARMLAQGAADDFFLGEYKILERIGRGNMAGVFRAVHSLGQIVAIKVLPPTRAKDPQKLARFQRESSMAMRLKHPNIVRAFQKGESKRDVFYLVMEYLEGETLDEILKRRTKLPPLEAVTLINQALLGLQHMHELGMVHRDLKPSNLMMVPAVAPGQPDTTLNATLKILDVGLGRANDDEIPAMTSPEDILGTPHYTAPEQTACSATCDIRADIYSLGCVLYQLLTGTLPFYANNAVDMMLAHARDEAKPLRDFDPKAPEMLQQVLNWMMAKSPDQRYPTPRHAAQALRIFLHSETNATQALDPRRLLSPESQVDMQPFLNWLDEENSKLQGTTPTEPSTIIPAPIPPPAPVPAREPIPSPVVYDVGPGRKNASAGQAPPPAPTPPARRDEISILEFDFSAANFDEEIKAVEVAEPPKKTSVVIPTASGPAKGDSKFGHKKLPSTIGAAKTGTLVFPPRTKPTADKVGQSRFTRRDYLMMCFGALGLGVAGLLSWALAQWLKTLASGVKAPGGPNPNENPALDNPPANP